MALQPLSLSGFDVALDAAVQRGAAAADAAVAGLARAALAFHLRAMRL
jgi:hypothetical protein